MQRIILTLIVATVGGIIGLKLKIPAGALIGGMVAVAIYNMSTSKAVIPNNFKIAAQIVVGGMIGLNFTMETISGLKKLIVPAVILMVGLTVLSIGLGFLISKLTGMDLVTALFSSSPGGLADMVLISDAYGADTSTVAILHLIRLVTVVTFIPIAIKVFTKLIN